MQTEVKNASPEIVAIDTFQTFKQFLNHVETNYQEEDQLIIEDFMSYYINEYNNFGNYNCKSTYEDNLEADKTGELHRMSLIGFEFEKKIQDKYNNKRLNKKNINNNNNSPTIILHY